MEFNAYVSASQSWTTDFGDDLFASIPNGWHPEVVAQPTHGTVEINADGNGWRFTAIAMNVPPEGLQDSWQWRPTNGAECGAAQTVAMRLYSID